MTDKMKSFVKGILLGLCGHPLPQGEKEPVAYLYNGVRLPLVTISAYKTYVCTDGNGNYYYGQDSGVEFFVSDDGKMELQYAYVLQDGAWSTEKIALWKDFYLVWANKDAYLSDGRTIYLAASEPVPVYE